MRGRDNQVPEIIWLAILYFGSKVRIRRAMAVLDRADEF
ncbi:unnamed protein product [Acidithrix sp. C25]|nr:unnamed protein product [Acidithrix sp. C25]